MGFGFACCNTRGHMISSLPLKIQRSDEYRSQLTKNYEQKHSYSCPPFHLRLSSLYSLHTFKLSLCRCRLDFPPFVLPLPLLESKNRKHRNWQRTFDENPCWRLRPFTPQFYLNFRNIAIILYIYLALPPPLALSFRVTTIFP